MGDVSSQPKEIDMSADTAAQVKAMASFKKDLVPANVKAAMKEAGAASSDLWKVPRSQLRVLAGFNVRVKNDELTAHIRSIADSIKANGFFPNSPLAGYVANENGEQVIYITDGHCRFAASELAASEGCELDTLPVVLSPKGSNLEDLTVALLAKATGKPLSQIEKGIVVKRLSSFGWEPEQISERTCIPVARVNDLLTLMSAPAQIRQAVEAGEVAASVAIQELKTRGSGAVETIEVMKKDAKAKGHKQVTARNVGNSAAKVMRKEGPALLATVRSIKDDPAFANIGDELKAKISELLGKFDAAEAASTKATNGKADASAEAQEAEDAQAESNAKEAAEAV